MTLLLGEAISPCGRNTRATTAQTPSARLFVPRSRRVPRCERLYRASGASLLIPAAFTAGLFRLSRFLAVNLCACSTIFDFSGAQVIVRARFAFPIHQHVRLFNHFGFLAIRAFADRAFFEFRTAARSPRYPHQSIRAATARYGAHCEAHSIASSLVSVRSSPSSRESAFCNARSPGGQISGRRSAISR